MDQAPLTDDDDRPPILGSWRNLYLTVLFLHAVIIAMFYYFTHLYA